MLDIIDPFYSQGAGRDIRDRLSGIGISVHVTNDIDSVCLADRHDGAIWVRPGLALPYFHQIIAWAAAHILWGPEVAPAGPDLIPSVQTQALVLPFPRGRARGTLR